MDNGIKKIIIDVELNDEFGFLAPTILSIQRRATLLKLHWIDKKQHFLCKRMVDTVDTIQRDGMEFIRYTGVRQ